MMINSLINLDFKVENETKNKSGFTITEYAKSFINGLGKTQRERFKQMLENGFTAGMSVAKNYNVNYDDFINEVKKQLNI